MFWNGRVYFLSERDAVMNIYSMNTQGQGLKQEIHQHGFDIESASLSDGRIVYACGSDLWLLDLGTGHEEVIPITLVSDFPDLSWSADSRWLAYVEPAGNQFVQIKMLNVDSGTIQAITSDRYNSVNPVWSSDGKWLIEGHGVEPDIVVDDLPHAGFAGFDAQLQAAIELLKKEIQADPRPVPSHPPYPDKSFTYRP
jgi:tricorn protease-like protein